MRYLIVLAAYLLFFTASFSQKPRVAAKNYPSLLWEITGKGMKKPSYLFGTMHVSSKMVFHLSDSFYLGIKNSDVVALETNMGSWQDDFSRYEFEGRSFNFNQSYLRKGFEGQGDYFTISTLQFPPYEKLIELALYSSPAMINSFLYRSNSDKSVDFEEDTYLDMHIYQAGKKWGKKVCGVENFDRSMELMKEAYIDAENDKSKTKRSFDFDDDFSYSKLEDAYRTGNLDLLDTINKVNSTSAAFDEKFLYVRNEIQANSIDSIIKTNQSLFVGVGAAHLPGQRGVIELLRRKGYILRPIQMLERDSRHKDEIEKLRVPLKFSKQTSADGFFSVDLPGKLYDFNSTYGIIDQQQFADMSNGSYYMVTRINTNSILWGHSEEVVLRKIDSVIYENVPGKILTKKAIAKNGYKGFEVMNRTRRGDFQRYNIFVTPFEIILFKMSGNSDYVREGTEADRFFSSIQFGDYAGNWKKWSPSFGGFEALFPHDPVVVNKTNWQFMALDTATNTGFGVIRTDIHNYDFVEEDSFDLNLMEESFASSDFIDRQLSRRQTKTSGYSSLETKYKYKDGSVALVRFLIQGPHYYTLVAHSKTENPKMAEFINSFKIKPFIYNEAKQITDTALYFTVTSPVPLEKPKKLSMYPDLQKYTSNNDEETAFVENGTYKNRVIANDSTGEKIFVLFSKPSRYFYDEDSTTFDTSFLERSDMKWQYRSRKNYELPNDTRVYEYVAGDPRSSRYIQGKFFTKNGISYGLVTQGDTTSEQSAFIGGFFESFVPADTVKGVDPFEKKGRLFFRDFFSKDSVLYKKAVANVSRIAFDSADLPQLKKCIQTLSWKDKRYMDVKNEFVWKLAEMSSKESADYLKDIYYAAGDTVELQYTALTALLNHKTTYAYKLFRDIMINEPPVLQVDNDNSSSYRSGRRGKYNMYNYPDYSYKAKKYNFDYDTYRSQYFLDELNDSLQLTATIYKDLLPLMNIDDYEQPIMDLAGVLVDSSMITAEDYEIYLTKFLIEAKQLLKKQIISEKNKSIEQAQKDEEDKTNIYNYDVKDQDYGNSGLSLYATLLMPFWDKNAAVPQFINQLLQSGDKRLKYSTMMLLLRNKRSVPDTLVRYFAGLDDFRYELYTDLKESRMFHLFPAAYNNQMDLARSKLVEMASDYNRPDSVVYIDKLPARFKERSGYVFFFKYKNKKDDNSWKLGTVGIIPTDPKQFGFEKKEKYWEERKYEFTELTDTRIDSEEPLKEQLKKALKKVQYAKRSSSAEFYSNEGRMKGNFFPTFNVGEE